ncbi:AbrB/MazE/SpoVT family DNA-binding domain-containing protein [Methylovulum psychrotolerans]|uniref:AbrB/MazE/SpoVT family DNA-binding domain-containing protein n=1 Tax=Methylovulum psychrotolerans TaxID=1704499 RepID=UPI001BFF5ABB|nr:AbrB/MazE/SpoVT family DNA-binding domain-containing protein [Methylovulum psychrotolerans]MBT9096186.1 AbrB/MazE/SpoVT family DNA-binding domain-containing protein [Methylovulum psychrotolerans]
MADKRVGLMVLAVAYKPPTACFDTQIIRFILEGYFSQRQDADMPKAQMHSKHQVTLPASIVEKAHLAEDCTFDVDYINGAIVLTPINPNPKKDDVLSYAGLFSGAWGATPEEVEQTINTLHKEWVTQHTG